MPVASDYQALHYRIERDAECINTFPNRIVLDIFSIRHRPCYRAVIMYPLVGEFSGPGVKPSHLDFESQRENHQLWPCV